MANLLDRLDEEVRSAGGPLKVSKALGVAKGTVYNWLEKGNIPADKLEALESLGCDACYIVTGRRVNDPPGRRVYQSPDEVLEAALAVQGKLGLSFTADQLKALMAFAWDNQAGEEELVAFVGYAHRVAGVGSDDN
jgi:hypothetical protein